MGVEAGIHACGSFGSIALMECRAEAAARTSGIRSDFADPTPYLARWNPYLA